MLVRTPGPESERQDLNLRPPGPQPERSRRTTCDSALWSDLSCSELGSVALDLDPGLDPVRFHTRVRRRPEPSASRGAAGRRASGGLRPSRVASVAARRERFEAWAPSDRT